MMSMFEMLAPPRLGMPAFIVYCWRFPLVGLAGGWGLLRVVSCCSTCLGFCSSALYCKMNKAVEKIGGAKVHHLRNNEINNENPSPEWGFSHNAHHTIAPTLFTKANKHAELPANNTVIDHCNQHVERHLSWAFWPLVTSQNAKSSVRKKPVPSLRCTVHLSPNGVRQEPSDFWLNILAPFSEITFLHERTPHRTCPSPCTWNIPGMACISVHQ